MLRTLIDSTNRFRQRLTRLDNQPLGRAALTVLIFLDFFILSSIFNGLADHTRQLVSPGEYIPPLCQDIVIDQNWNTTNRLDKLSNLVRQYQARRYTYYDGRDDTSRQQALCAPILTAFKSIRDDGDLARNLGESRRLKGQEADLRAEIDRLKGAYDTQLLEKIAGQTKPGVTAQSLRKEMTDKTAALDDLVGKQATLDDALAQDPKVLAFFRLVDGIRDADRTALADELRRLNFWFPAKRLGMEMLFLLPLLAVFYFWNSRSIGADRPFQALVSSHLLVVTMIPVLAKILQLVYDILPRKLIRHVIELLESLKLVAIWHYLVIAVAILAAMALIYLFQKKLFSRERLMQRRIARGECQDCGRRLPKGSRHCPACGADQYRTCDHCGQSTLIHGRYCTSCGQEAPVEG